MTNMQPVSQSARARSGPTEEFIELCKTLYGDVVDPEVVWTDVIKLSPDQADLNASRTRRNVERSSNAVGIAAGSLGLAGALRDDRLSEGTGRVSRALAATGRKLPKLADRVKNPKVRAAMAATAVGTQVANLGGDALIAGTLKPKKTTTSKRGVHGVPRDLRPQVDGLRKLWKTPAGNTLQPTGGVSKKSISLGDAGELLARQNAKRAGLVSGGLTHTPKGGMPAPRPAATAAPAPAAAAPKTRAELRRQELRAARGDRYQQRQSMQEDAKAMLSTNTGKVVAGAGAAYLGTKALQPRSESAYYGKSADEMEFRGEFSKFDDAKKQAFGWASVVKVNGEDVVDRQGDYIDLNDLEDAAYAYVHKSRVGGDMHRRNGEAPHKVSDMIESMVFTDDKVAKMGLPDDFPRGWWVGYQIHDDRTWEEVRKKGRTGFSIHGKGLRKDYDLDERR